MAGTYKNHLTVSAEEWSKAEQYFNEHPDDVKMRKPPQAKGDAGDKSLHSFIKVNGKIWCVANGEYLGRGGKGKAKVVQDKEGFVFVVKVTGSTKKSAQSSSSEEDENATELKVSELLGVSHGQAVRPLDASVQLFKDEGDGRANLTTDEKIYTILDYIPGQDLDKAIYEADTPKTPLSCLLVLAKSGLAIDKLHQLGVIHADIKEQNFKAWFQGMDVQLREMDYGFAKVLDSLKNEKFVITQKIQGTETYIAPEIFTDQRYSFSSDVYALGKMYENLITFSSQMREQHLSAKEEAEQELRTLQELRIQQQQLLSSNPELAKYQSFLETLMGEKENVDPDNETEYQAVLAQFSEDPAEGIEFLNNKILLLSPEVASLNDKIAAARSEIEEHDAFIEVYTAVKEDYDKFLTPFLQPMIEKMMADSPHQRPPLREVLAALKNRLAAFPSEDSDLTNSEKKAIESAIKEIDKRLETDVDFLNTATNNDQVTWSLGGQDHTFLSSEMNSLKAKMLLAQLGKGNILQETVDKCRITLTYSELETLKERKSRITTAEVEKTDVLDPTKTAIFSEAVTGNKRPKSGNSLPVSPESSATQEPSKKNLKAQ